MTDSDAADRGPGTPPDAGARAEIVQHVYRDRARAESFGSVAEQYDRARPGYPPALLDEIATRGGTDVLDVGCGTGKAAALLQDRGLTVLGVEIDAGMAAVARRHGLDVEVASFESWDDRARRFDILTCAQAWHWVDPVAGAAKAARVLRPGGSVALFWNVHDEDPDVRDALNEAYVRCAPGMRAGFGRQQGSANEAAQYLAPLADAGFVELGTREFAWEQTYDRAALLELLPTFSDHHLLPPEQLSALLEEIGAVVDRFGGAIRSHYATHLLLGRTPA